MIDGDVYQEKWLGKSCIGVGDCNVWYTQHTYIKLALFAVYSVQIRLILTDLLAETIENGFP